ncbi:MFS transporter [Nesterenkonia sandarakina]|uniref:MFS family permease n=1 Tax=Nesterenkonia sandarakina TaxID=272918 RepID=A0A7Z0J2F8_9MICC|nr:MFS transporter [Nesterenkonia sandarakina]NYJ16220.1 MFS family permease [Nesterenkonia sandarakina]
MMSLGRRFRVLLGASGLSNLSDGLAFVTMPLLAASMTDDPLWIAGLATMYALTRLLVVLPIGVYVDQLDRRSLMVSANLLRGLALVLLAASIQFGAASLLALYTVMAVVATLESLADGAAVAMLPGVVPKPALDRANSRIASVQLISDEFVGPPLGGLLFTVAAVLPVYVMGGVWAAAGVLALALPRSDDPKARAESRQAFGTQVAEGARWLTGHRTIGKLSLIGGLASAGYMLPFSVLVIFAQDRLDLASFGYGLMLAGSALGGLLAALLVPRLRRRWNYRTLITASLALGSLSLACLAWTSAPMLAAILLALYIFHAVLWNICATSLRQWLVPGELLGRVGAATSVVSLLGLAIGSALGGLLAGVDIRLPTASGSLVFAACAALAWLGLPGRDPDSSS